jgi:hypothetical protein
VVNNAYENEAKAGQLQFKNHFYLERGPYDIIAVLDENANESAYAAKGPVIDLYDPQLPVLAEKNVAPGTQAFLYNIDRVKSKKKPQVLATAARVYNEVVKKRSYSFLAKSPLNTTNSMRILLPGEPKKIIVKDHSGNTLSDVKSSWDKLSNTCFLGFENSPDGINVQLEW